MLPKARAQNDLFGSFTDAILKRVAHEESEVWTSLNTYFLLPRKAYYSSQVITVCVASVEVEI